MTLDPTLKESIRLIGGGMKAVLFNPSGREWWGWLLLGALVGLWHFGAFSGKVTLREGLRLVVPARIYLSRSILHDWACIALKLLVFRVMLNLILGVQIEDFVFGDMASAALGRFTGPPPPSLPSTAVVNLLYSVAAFVAFEFGWYAMHWLTHRIPMLWAFHKVHHGTTLMNPLASRRVHVFDDLMLMAGVGIPSGVVHHVFKAFGYTPSAIVVVGDITLLYLFLTMLGALRHSHIPISFGRLERFISSPVLHQVHHSCLPQHVNKNFGYYLVAFDKLFGTLHVPQPGEKLVFGLDLESAAKPDPSFARMYFLQPFRDCAQYARTGQWLGFAKGRRDPGGLAGAGQSA